MNVFDKKYIAKLTEKGSKFIAYGRPINDEDEATAFLDAIKKEHHKATHHCPAYRLCEAKLNSSGENSQVDVQVSEYSNDDGEPSGTAGLPILNALKSATLVQSMIVVVRYFGGTKLGTSGLIDAYGSAAQQLIEKAKLSPLSVVQELRLTYPYDQQSEIDQFKHRFKIVDIDSEYLEKVTLTIGITLDQREALLSYLDGKQHLGLEYQLLNPTLRSIS
jgi:uncharacterized YigZ family protein